MGMQWFSPRVSFLDPELKYYFTSFNSTIEKSNGNAGI